jgi:hypothetical protein
MVVAGGIRVPRNGEDHARPQKHDTGDCTTILAVLQRASVISRQQLRRLRGILA